MRLGDNASVGSGWCFSMFPSSLLGSLNSYLFIYIFIFIFSSGFPGTTELNLAQLVEIKC